MPVKASGVGARHAVAFARRRGKGWALAVAPRSTFRLAPGPPTGPEAWGSSTLALPSGAPKRWTDVFTGSTVEASRARLPIGQVLGRFPVALLVP